MMEDITVEGKIVDIRHGEKRMNKGFVYGYMVLKLKVNHSFFSVAFSTSKFNDFGFFPKAGHWVRVTGKLFHKGDDGPSVKYVSNLEHIEKPAPPLADQIMERLKKIK